MCLLRGGGLYTKILSPASGITRLILTTRAEFHFHLTHDLPQNQCPHLLLQQPPKKQLEPKPDKDIHLRAYGRICRSCSILEKGTIRVLEKGRDLGLSDQGINRPKEALPEDKREQQEGVRVRHKKLSVIFSEDASVFSRIERSSGGCEMMELQSYLPFQSCLAAVVVRRG
ncbi:hypothetical protein L1887_28488 [Cichorium endivia]|nr:hypothetical protein L1887_28488 [Cichorium endivia]